MIHAHPASLVAISVTWAFCEGKRIDTCVRGSRVAGMRRSNCVIEKRTKISRLFILCQNFNFDICARPVQFTLGIRAPSGKKLNGEELETCGQSAELNFSARVYAGEPATKGAWPWMTMIAIQDRDKLFLVI